MLPMMGALLSGGASLLSGLFGRSSAKKQARKEEDAIREANRVATENADLMNITARARADAAALVPRQMSRGVDTEAFMADAERMGFNPLTFLRSGALSAYEWTCDTGSGAMQAAEAGQYIPQLAPVLAQTKVPSMGEVFGNALVSGANQYLSGAEQQNRFQQEVMLAQLRGAQSFGAYSGMRSFSTPQAQERSETGKTVDYVTMLAQKMAKSDLGLADPFDLALGESLVVEPNSTYLRGRIGGPLYVPVIDNSATGHGTVRWMPRQDIADSEQMAAAGLLTGASWLEQFKSGPAFAPFKKLSPPWKQPLYKRHLAPAVSPGRR